MKTLRSLRYAVMAITAVSTLTLLGCGGCATQEQGGGKNRQAVVWELSPEARTTYAYLLYDQALRQEDEGALLTALKELLNYNPPPNVFIETGVWLMGRRSPLTLPALEQGLQRFPADLSLNLLYAEALQESGQVDKAITHMRVYAVAQPGSIDAKLELALLLVKSGRHDEAESLLKGIAGKHRTALVEYYHARALVGMKRPADAVPHLQKAVSLMPDFVEAMAELAYIYEQQRKWREAHALYEKMLSYNDSGQEVLLRLIALSLRLEQPDKALDFVKKGPGTAAFQATAASMFIEARQYDQAEPLLQGLIGSPDAPADLYFYLAAIAYEGHKDIPKALNWLENIKPGHNAYGRALLLRVQLLADAERLEEALQTVRSGQELMPEQQEFWSIHVRLLAGLKRQDEAMRVADDMIKRWPDDADLAFLRASLLEEMGRKKAALAAMEDIIARHPTYYQALNYVGYTLAEENRELERALALLYKAVELSPRSDYILDSLAWALYRQGKLQEAWKAISEAVTVTPEPDPTIWEHYGDIALAIGNTVEARKGYYKALEHKPANADSLRERLSQL